MSFRPPVEPLVSSKRVTGAEQSSPEAPFAMRSIDGAIAA
jgi:hypothetical protein